MKMFKKITSIAGFFVLMPFITLSMDAQPKEKKDTSKFHLRSLDTKKVRFVKFLYDKKDKLLGGVYGVPKENGYYSSLMIGEGKSLTPIYVADKLEFTNTKGKEKIPINSESFYGFKIVIIGKDYLEIQPYWNDNNRKRGSDSIVINWNYEKKVFEILLTP